MKYLKPHRHGDVYLKPIINIPEKAHKAKREPLAYGEVTGHSHQMVGDTYNLFELDGHKYVQVLSETPLIHEEHHQQIILPGSYEIVKEREYSYEDEELKTVLD